MLLTLAGVLDVQRCPAASVDIVKLALRSSLVLDHVAQLAANASTVLADKVPTMTTVRGLWRLHTCLKILEHASFACTEVEAHMASITVDAGASCPSKSLPQWLVDQISVLRRHAGRQGLKRVRKVLCAALLKCFGRFVAEASETGCCSFRIAFTPCWLCL